LDRADTLRTIGDTLAEILDVESLALTEASTAEDVSDWDSLAQVRLMIALEAHYGIRFESTEINAPGNVGELIDLIHSKAGA
jgi:acyl carrier protein